MIPMLVYSMNKNLTNQKMKTKLNDIVFLDIETVSHYQELKQAELKERELWEQKTRFSIQENDNTIDQLYKDKAGVFAEFSRIITISIGYFVNNEQERFVIKSFYFKDENRLLQEFMSYINEVFLGKPVFCAHNGKEFDYPFLCRRMLINDIKIPEWLRLQNVKPWEVKHLDTMEMWKFGDYKRYTSLDLLAHTFNLTSSKIEMKGEDVHDVFYEENNLAKIVRYCEEDVKLTAKVYLKLTSEKSLVL